MDVANSLRRAHHPRMAGRHAQAPGLKKSAPNEILSFACGIEHYGFSQYWNFSHARLKLNTEGIRRAGRESAFSERYLPGWGVIDGLKVPKG